MKHTPTCLLAAAALAMFVPSCASTSNTTTTATTTRVPMSSASNPGSGAALAGKLFSEVNQYRNSIGAPSVTRHAGLDRLAQQHADYLKTRRGKKDVLVNRFVGHDGFNFRMLYAQRFLKMESVSENMAAAQGLQGDVTSQLVDAWIKSSGHQFNMSQKDWKYSGMGVAVDSDGAVFATQIFATESHSQSALMDQLRQ